MISKKEKVLKNVNKLRQEAKQEERRFFESLVNAPKARQNLQQYVTTWSDLYSLSFLEFIAMFAIVVGAAPLIEEAAKHSDSLDAKETFLKKFDDFEISTEFLEKYLSKDEAHQFIASFIIALHFNMAAKAHRNRSICEMLEQIRNRVEKHEEIIFEAISIDASVIANSEIAEFISRWTFERNKVMLDKLSKAIVGKYPIGKRMKGLDDYRLMTTVLEEIDGEVTSESVYEMNQLLNLIAEGKDLESAIQKHLQRRKKDKRTSNGQSTS